MMPSLFVAHGAPTLAVETNGYTEFLRDLGRRLPKPKAVVIFSAHWVSRVQQVSGVFQYETIHDFYGFPEELYTLEYPARGDVTLSLAVQELLRSEGIPCEENAVRGLDHGAWAPLMLMYPAADVPIVALSVHPGLTPEEQFRIGRALAPLRERGVLIVGSGGIVHNLRRLAWNGGAAEDWAVRFDDWVAEQLETWNTEAIFDYERRAPNAEEAVPTAEHFVPLLLAMGASDTSGGEGSAAQLYREYQFGSLGLSCWQFGGQEG